jgi:hypothetical protein
MRTIIARWKFKEKQDFSPRNDVKCKTFVASQMKMHREIGELDKASKELLKQFYRRLYKQWRKQNSSATNSTESQA